MSNELELYGTVDLTMYIEFKSKITLDQYFDILNDLKRIIHSNISYDFVRDLDFEEDLDTLGYYEETGNGSTTYKFCFEVNAHGYMEEEDLNTRKNLISLNIKEVKRIINEKYGIGAKLDNNEIKDINLIIKNKTFSEKNACANINYNVK